MLALAAAAILLIVGRTLAGVYSDFLWYEALGASALWRARMSAVSTLRVGTGLAGTLFAFANLYAVRNSVISLVFPRRLANLEIGEEVPGRYLMGAALGLAIILGLLLALPSDSWMSLVLARAGRPFNETDPYFGQDLGFFVYWLPLENTLWMWAFFLVIVVSIAVILLYALTPSLKWQRGGLYASAYVRRHFTVLVGMLLFLLAWSFRLDMYGMLIDGGGAEHTFSWADHRVSVPGDLILSLITLGAALIVLWAGFAGQLRLAAISVLTVIGLALVIREIAPVIASHTGTDLQRTRREQAYVGTRATFTRRAFDTDVMSRADSTIAYRSLSAALPFVPVWDPPALSRATNATRSADEPALPVAWRATPVALLAEVIDAPPQGAALKAPWTAARIVASDADERGAPIRLGGPDGAGEDNPIEPPLVYPNAVKMAVVADSLTHTTGTPLESFFARLATAWSMQNFHLLSGDLPQPHPTLIAHRDVRDRVDMYAPFFAQGRRVNPILLGDSLYWTVDLYSVSDMYPLSHHYQILGDDRSYFRHAAVAIVQASTGEVVVVADSALDPIAESWKSRLPSLFGTWATLPAGIRTQLAPPIDGLVAQANAFGQYGMRGESDPPRHVPTLNGADSSAFATDHLPIVLPGGRSTALALPLVDDADRLRGLMIGTGGTTRSTRWYPLANAGPRWNAVIDKLRLVDSAGSAAREGPLAHGGIRVVPVGSSIAFVQPNYRWRSQTTPTLNRVALLSGDTARSVAPPFGVSPPVAATSAPAGDLRTSVNSLYAAMRDALRRGDFAAFGRAFEALGKVLARK